MRSYVFTHPLIHLVGGIHRCLVTELCGLLVNWLPSPGRISFINVFLLKPSGSSVENAVGAYNRFSVQFTTVISTESQF